jgi:hypothetical protein
VTALVRRDAVLEVERERSWVALMAPAAEFARAVANTDFVPRSMRNNPAAITAAILYGDELGLGPMQSINGVVIIDGSPRLYAKTQRALVLAAGHKIWPEELTNTRATWCGLRDDQTTRITWTMDDARRAKLDGKPNWRGYPRAMLSARASADVVGAVFSDVVAGLASVEEADELDEVPPALAALEAPKAAATTRRQRASSRARAATPPVSVPPQLAPAASLPRLPGELDGGPDVPPLDAMPVGPVAESPALMSDSQRRRLMKLAKNRGYGVRADRLTMCADVVGHDVQSASDLTTSEADRVLDYLESLPVPNGGDIPASGASPAGSELDEQELSVPSALGDEPAGDRALEDTLPL